MIALVNGGEVLETVASWAPYGIETALHRLLRLESVNDHSHAKELMAELAEYRQDLQDAYEVNALNQVANFIGIVVDNNLYGVNVDTVLAKHKLMQPVIPM